MQAGVSTFAFGWAVAAPPTAAPAFTADTLLHFAAAHGASVVQFGDNLPLHLLPKQSLEHLRASATTAGLAIETGARGLTTGHLHRYIELSRTLDARLLRFVIDAADYAPPLDTVLALLREALPALAAADVVLGIENHDRLPSRDLRGLIDALGSAHVGICLDTANSLGAGEGIADVLATLAPVCVNLHVKDFAITRLPHHMGFTVTGRPLGQGMLPVEHVLATVAAHGRCSSAVLELWTPPETEAAATLAKERAWAEHSMRVLCETLDRLPSSRRSRGTAALTLPAP